MVDTKPMTTSRITDETSYQKTLSSLSKQDKPPRVLCFLMNILESYRQARKMGWSRAWNKYGMRTFQSFKLDRHNDTALMQHTEKSLQSESNIPNDALVFMQNILHESEHLMGFIFISEYTEKTDLYESVTLSFGSKTKDNPRSRERFDIIFDCPIINNQPEPLSRIRLYVDPYRDGEKKPLYQCCLTPPLSTEFLSLFEHLCDCSWQWHGKQEKLWDHWTSHYIDYFGDRHIKLQSSHFYLNTGERMSHKTEHHSQV